ncbi:unnamed protein product [Gordionus sp. m RMFG-2023]
MDALTVSSRRRSRLPRSTSLALFPVGPTDISSDSGVRKPPTNSKAEGLHPKFGSWLPKHHRQWSTQFLRPSRRTESSNCCGKS